MAATSTEEFHRWRTICRGKGAPVIAALLAPRFQESIPELIGRYLNEYDEDAEGRWTSFSAEAIARISCGAPERALLRVQDGCVNCPAGSFCLQKKVCAAMAGLGHAILEGRAALEATRGMRNVFRIAVGVMPEGAGDVHLAIQPREFAAHYMPVLIGDAFLEWSAERRTAGQQQR